jgi:hypothetical protein
MALAHERGRGIQTSGHHIVPFDDEIVSMFVWCICTSGTLHAPGQHRAAPSGALVRDGAIQMQAATAGESQLAMPWSMDEPTVKGDKGNSLPKQI